MPSENQNDDVLISIDDVKRDFEDFLNVENNDRIFFSGIYGIGKTFFLREFAKEKKDEYFTIHLYPVNYQIRENSLDIVDLLKYDILIEFLCKEKEKVEQILNEYANERDFCSFLNMSKKELSRKGIDFLSNLPNSIAILGKSLKVALDIRDSWQLFKKKEKIGLDNFLEKQRDGLKETDFLSQLIWDINNRIKKDKNKKTILILDDLDRLDPDNIFRILNVFSAFFDKEKKNKFGFSKIIIVGDYDNIKNIFHHKYGKETNFQGDMDKFFSIEPYKFDNNAAIKQKVGFLVKNIKTSKTSSGKLSGFSGITEYFLIYFFEQSVEYGVINLRQLLKSVNFQIPVMANKKGQELNRKQYFDLGLKTLFTIFNGEDVLLNCIFKILQQRQKNGFLYFSGNKNFFKHAIFLMLKALGDIPTNLQTITIKEYKFGDFTIPGIKVSLKNEIVQIEDKNLEKAFLIVLANYILAEGYKRYD